MNPMINTWGELFTAIKTWWNTELKFETKKLPEPSEYKDILRPVQNISSGEWNRIQRAALNKLADQYFSHLRDRLKHGEILSNEEQIRLRNYTLHQDIWRFPNTLPEPPKNMESNEQCMDCRVSGSWRRYRDYYMSRAV